MNNMITPTEPAMFTEVNPDKGTETRKVGSGTITFLAGLQKLTPIRGRKRCLHKESF